jgi:hypothetical protein
VLSHRDIFLFYTSEAGFQDVRGKESRIISNYLKVTIVLQDEYKYGNLTKELLMVAE